MYAKVAAMVKFRLRCSPSNRSVRRSNSRGFTLVEVLVVITIIALIMSLVGPRVLNYLADSKVKAARIQIESLASAVELYYLDTGQYPSTAQGLGSLTRRTDVVGWSGPYLKGNEVPNDPWGKPYVYRMPGQRGTYEILSYGADGQEGGAGAAADVISSAR